jgi:hypothetical protein
METLWIPNNCNHHFAVPNHMFHPFRELLTRLNLNFFVVCRQIEPGLIQSHITFANYWSVQTLRVWAIRLADRFEFIVARLSGGGNPIEMLDDKSQGPAKHRQIFAHGIRLDFASFCTDANTVWSRAWRIALSITSGGRAKCFSSFWALQWDARR